MAVRIRVKNFLGSDHVVDQLSFSMFPSILTFVFDLALGSFLTFCGPSGLFWVKVGFRDSFVVHLCSWILQWFTLCVIMQGQLRHLMQVLTTYTYSPEDSWNCQINLRIVSFKTLPDLHVKITSSTWQTSWIVTYCKRS